MYQANFLNAGNLYLLEEASSIALDEQLNEELNKQLNELKIKTSALQSLCPLKSFALNNDIILLSTYIDNYKLALQLRQPKGERAFLNDKLIEIFKRMQEQPLDERFKAILQEVQDLLVVITGHKFASTEKLLPLSSQLMIFDQTPESIKANSSNPIAKKPITYLNWHYLSPQDFAASAGTGSKVPRFGSSE